MCRTKKYAGSILLIIILLSLALAIISCGDSGGGGSHFAGGGTGGTGKSVGTITAFGSIFVNEFEYDTFGVPVRVNGSAATENDLEIGMKVEIELQDGKTVRIDYESEIRGPIDSVNAADNRLVVLGQTVIADSTSIFQNVTGPGNLTIGDIVEISGFFDANNDVVASYIELPVNQGPQQFTLKGVVLTHDQTNKQFTVGGITVDYSNVNDPPEFSIGSFVEVWGTKSSNILHSGSLEIESQLPAGNAGDNMVIEGIITNITSQSDFEVNGQRVNTNSQTSFKNGAAGDVSFNVKVQVKGSIDNAGILIAREVKFRFQGDSDVDINGNVEVIDPVNSTATVFGLAIHATANTKMKDTLLKLKPFSLGDIQAGDFLGISGFLNENGKVIAEKLERENDSGNDEIKGAVDMESENQPDSISVLGITIDVSGSGVTFKDTNNNVITDVDFFNTIDDSKDPGDIVEVKGSYSGGSFFTAGEIKIRKIN